jgi:hypothetical protein
VSFRFVPDIGASRKKKTPRAADPSQLKNELKRVTEQLESRDRELAEASVREAATGDILRVIASSPNDLQSVLEVVAKNAARLCGPADALIYRFDARLVQSLPIGKYWQYELNLMAIDASPEESETAQCSDHDVRIFSLTSFRGLHERLKNYQLEKIRSSSRSQSCGAVICRIGNIDSLHLLFGPALAGY